MERILGEALENCPSEAVDGRSPRSLDVLVSVIRIR